MGAVAAQEHGQEDFVGGSSELRSVSPISTPGVFPWQKRKRKRTSTNSRTRGKESRPQHSSHRENPEVATLKRKCTPRIDSPSGLRVSGMSKTAKKDECSPERWNPSPSQQHYSRRQKKIATTKAAKRDRKSSPERWHPKASSSDGHERDAQRIKEKHL